MLLAQFKFQLIMVIDKTQNRNTVVGDIMKTMLWESSQSSEKPLNKSVKPYYPYYYNQAQEHQKTEKKKFSFNSLFQTIDSTINTSDPQKLTPGHLISEIEKELESSKAKPLMKTFKKRVKKRYQKQKDVGKCIKLVNKYFTKYKGQQHDESTERQEVSNFLGALFMIASKAYNKNKTSGQQNEGMQKDVKINSKIKEWIECEEDIESDFFVCTECPTYVICESCEDETEHEHVFYKIKNGKKYTLPNGSKLTANPPITNFPIPEILGKNWANELFPNWKSMTNFNLSKSLPSPQVRTEADELKSLKKRMKRPAVIQAPESDIIAHPGQIVEANFMIQNQSDNNLPKELYLKKTSIDDIAFDTVQGRPIINL